jgi:hypothetical protein
LLFDGEIAGKLKAGSDLPSVCESHTIPLKKSRQGGKITKRLIELRQLPGSTFSLQRAHAVALVKSAAWVFASAALLVFGRPLFSLFLDP